MKIERSFGKEMTELDWKTFVLKRLLRQNVESYYIDWLFEIQKRLHRSTKKEATEYVDTLIEKMVEVLS